MTWLWSFPGRGASEGHLEGDEDGVEKIFRGEPERATPLLVDQDLAITMVETPRVGDVPCAKDSRRCPP
jgi:hypothetical protein